MARSSQMVISFPPFRGVTRRLVLANVVIYFAITILSLASGAGALATVEFVGLRPEQVIQHGWIWQLATYTFVNAGASVPAILIFALNMLVLWFLGSFMEQNQGGRWLVELYFVSVIGAGLAFIALAFALSGGRGLLTGCNSALFGLIVAFGVVYVDLEFMMIPFPAMMKAKYMVIVALLIEFALLFSEQRMLAFADLGGALTAFLYARYAPRRGFAIAGSEAAFGLRNRYYRWKRKRAARKFEVYMRKHRDN